MTKTTNSGWPDPTDWAKRLAEELSERREAYSQSFDIHERQKHLAGMLAQIVRCLNELPVVAERDLAFPMMQIVDALMQASEGHKPALLENRKDGATRKASAHWQAAKAQAVIAYMTLRDSGHPDPAGFVANEMNRAGLARRKGERQTAKSITRFVNDYELAIHEHEPSAWVNFAHERLSGFRSNSGWPVPVADAIAYTRSAFASPRFAAFISDPRSQA